MKLRLAMRRDAADLADVHALCFDMPWSVADIGAVMAGAGTLGIVCEDDDQPRGFILARAVADEAEVLTLAVDPAVRRQGVGRALLIAALAMAAERGAEVAFLEAAHDNAAALALYAACGFEIAGSRKAYYARPGGDRADAVMLRRTLNRTTA